MANLLSTPPPAPFTRGLVMPPKRAPAAAAMDLARTKSAEERRRRRALERHTAGVEQRTAALCQELEATRREIAETKWGGAGREAGGYLRAVALAPAPDRRYDELCGRCRANGWPAPSLWDARLALAEAGKTQRNGGWEGSMGWVDGGLSHDAGIAAALRVIGPAARQAGPTRDRLLSGHLSRLFRRSARPTTLQYWKGWQWTAEDQQGRKLEAAQRLLAFALQTSTAAAPDTDVVTRVGTRIRALFDAEEAELGSELRARQEAEASARPRGFLGLEDDWDDIMDGARMD